MKKAFDQTVRDLKREVNKKVLKVPGIEQKVRDATSNETWGPHGTVLAEIANASRNYHDYQLIMGVIWKRINDTGKNWRHVYKGLTVLEYLVANGSERVVDDIKEHAYQISTLSDFQYIDSRGRDQGNIVRKKSQSLVQLVNDKERIAEVRQKAAANRDKFRNASSTGGMYRPNSYSGGYGDRFEDGFGKDKESGYREEGRYGDSYNRDGDHYSRDSDERYDRDGYRDDDFRGRSRSAEGQKHGSRSRSYERDRDRAYEDDGNYSSRGNNARAEEQSQDGRNLDRKSSEPDMGAPPSYENAVSGGRSPTQSEKGNPSINHNASPSTVATGGQSPSVPSLNRSTSSSPVSHHVPKPDVSHNASAPSMAQSLTVPSADHYSPTHSVAYSSHAPHANQGADTFDEFDPRGPVSAPAPPTFPNGTSGDFLSDAFALVPVSSVETSAASQPSFSASASAFDQPFEDPFGDTPFRAAPQMNNTSVQPESVYSTQSYHPSTSQTADPVQSPGLSTADSAYTDQQDQDIDILAGILPLTVVPQAPPSTTNQTILQSSEGGFSYLSGTAAANGESIQQNGEFFQQVPVTPVSSHMPHQASVNVTTQFNNGVPPQTGSFQGASQMSAQGHTTNSQNHGGFIQSTSSAHNGVPSQPGSVQGTSQLSAQGHTTDFQHHDGGFIQRTSSAPLPIEHNKESFLPQYSPTQFAPQASGSQSAAVALQPGQSGKAPKSANEKFENKSSIWADTLSRGLVNLNISGSKNNPLADIGVDFDALNRKERRMEKPSAAPPISTVTMGKAMGSGSGVGRAGASAVRPPVGPMGMPNYGGMNQQSMGMNRAPGISMNYGIGLGLPMQQPTGGVFGGPQQFTMGGVGYGPQRPMVGVGYGPQRPMIGSGYGTQPPMMGGGYNPQQPFGRGYQ